MKRIAITNGNGQWFDLEKSEVYKEETRWDGHNWISVATDNQFHHERIHKTAMGKWVLNKWSDFQGTKQTYEVIDESEVVVWFLNQGMDLPEELEDLADAYEI